MVVSTPPAVRLPTIVNAPNVRPIKPFWPCNLAGNLTVQVSKNEEQVGQERARLMVPSNSLLLYFKQRCTDFADHRTRRPQRRRAQVLHSTTERCTGEMDIQSNSSCRLLAHIHSTTRMRNRVARGLHSSTSVPVNVRLSLEAYRATFFHQCPVRCPPEPCGGSPPPVRPSSYPPQRQKHRWAHLSMRSPEKHTKRHHRGKAAPQQKEDMMGWHTRQERVAVRRAWGRCTMRQGHHREQ